MPKKRSQEDPVVERLDEINTVLQNILILAGAKSGMSKAEVRSLVGVGDRRVSDVWRKIRAAPSAD